MIHGRDLKIYASDGTILVASARSMTLDIECETIPTSAPNDGSWVKKIAGRKSWSVNVAWLVNSTNDFRIKTTNVGNVYNLTFKLGDDTLYIGNAILSKCNVSAEVGSLIKGTIVFDGCNLLQEA